MEKSKVGVHTVAAMMPTLTKIFDLKRFTNNSIRPTAIRSMKRGGASDREITTVSGHRDEKSLQHYDPIATNRASAGMATSIANAGLDPKPKAKNIHASEDPFDDGLTDEFFLSQPTGEPITPRKREPVNFDISQIHEDLDKDKDPDWEPKDVSNAS